MTDVNIEIINYRYEVSDGEPETISYRAKGTCRSTKDGIKLEWDNRSGEYPTMIQLRMTDGQWVKYQIFIEQPKPQISPALKDLEKMGRGYVRRRQS